MISASTLALLLVVSSAARAGAGEVPIVDDAETPPGVSCEPADDYWTADDDGNSPPVLVERTEPIYPIALRRNDVEGEVTFRAVICTDGVPRRFEIDSEKGRGFRDEALKAVRRWRYRPAQRAGEPVAVRYAFGVSFRRNEWNKAEIDAWSRPSLHGAKVRDQDLTLPFLKKKVEPIYPAEHRAGGGDGKVVFQARIEKDGSVGAIKTLQATSYAFELAAREAVRQWVYEPARTKGEAVAIDFTISVAFKLRGAPFSKNRGKVTPPTLRHDVPPIYPPALLAERRNGSVSVEIFVARDGAIEKVEVLSATDPAFADAVRAVVPQWKFAPGRLDGVPTATSLKLTIPFEPPAAGAAGAEGTENR